jgi:hypothetical protein
LKLAPATEPAYRPTDNTGHEPDDGKLTRQRVNDVLVDSHRDGQKQPHQRAVSNPFHHAFTFVTQRENMAKEPKRKHAPNHHHPHHAVHFFPRPKSGRQRRVGVREPNLMNQVAKRLHDHENHDVSDPKSLVFHYFISFS